MKKLDQEMEDASAKKEDIENAAVTKNVKRCQEVLMLLGKSLIVERILRKMLNKEWKMQFWRNNNERR